MVVFSIPLSAVRTVESEKNLTRLHVMNYYALDKVFKIEFPTIKIKTSVIQQINLNKVKVLYPNNT